MDRQEAIQVLQTALTAPFIYGNYADALDMAIEALKADRPHGEWVDEDGNKVPLDKDGYPLGSCYCNQCHEWLVGSDEYAIKGNFCPSCGAIMYKGGDNE